MRVLFPYYSEYSVFANQAPDEKGIGGELRLTYATALRDDLDRNGSERESNRPHNRAEARSRMCIIICHPDVFSVVCLHNPPSTDCMLVIFLMICDYGFCGPVMNLIGCRQNHARFMFLTWNVFLTWNTIHVLNLRNFLTSGVLEMVGGRED